MPIPFAEAYKNRLTHPNTTTSARLEPTLSASPVVNSGWKASDPVAVDSSDDEVLVLFITVIVELRLPIGVTEVTTKPVETAAGVVGEAEPEADSHTDDEASVCPDMAS